MTSSTTVNRVPPWGIPAKARMVDFVIEDIKKRALHRTKILEGQLRGLEKMIEAEEYCVDIITLSLSIQKSLGSLNKLLVENHLSTHVIEMFDAGGEPRDRAISELVKIYELSKNRESNSRGPRGLRLDHRPAHGRTTKHPSGHDHGPPARSPARHRSPRGQW